MRKFVILLMVAWSAGPTIAADDLKTILDREIRRTAPDYVVYRPKSLDGSTFDTGNEHFLVFDGPDGSLMTVWTQSSHEGAGDHRIVFARSDDEGKTWTPPRHVVGPKRIGDGHMASWGFPITSKTGRIYVIYSQYQGVTDVMATMTGTMDCVYSDDMGVTWTKPQTIPMKKSPLDHPDPAVPSNWIVWQRPIRDLQGRWFTGFSRWISPQVRTPPHVKSWTALESVVEFMRFENIDDNPEPKDIKITYSAWGDKALRVGHYSNPALSVAHEPSLVRLPDKRLFCIMRTMSGYIWYSVSDDDGVTWPAPRPLLRRDHGQPILQPLCCCPIYPYGDDGRYILLHHNNDGRFEGSKPEETFRNRRPAFIALGEFRPDAEQPIWFSESKWFMDNGGKGIGPLKRRDLGVYTSVTHRKGNYVLWHPDRKFFLLGKKIPPAWLEDLNVPGFGPAAEYDRPEITKLGTIDLDMVEITPIVFKSKLYRFEYVRKNYKPNKTGDSYFRFVDVKSGKTTPPFAAGYHLGSAFVDADTVYVYGVKKWGGDEIRVFTSNDLKTWTSQSALKLPGWGIFNNAVCKDADGYVMAFEIGEPPEETGHAFTIRFARSDDLKTWKLTESACVYSKKKYTACPTLHFLDGWYYMIYLEARPGPTYEPHIVRSKDLKTWKASKLNPLMRYSTEDKFIGNRKFTSAQRDRIAKAVNRNNSDVDLCEFKGQVILYYSWGDQQGNEFLAHAVYNGTLTGYLKGFFPNR